MKLIAKSLIYLSCFCFTILEARTLAIKFDHSTQEDHTIEHIHSCRKLTIENRGIAPITNFFPYVNEQSFFTYERLAEKIGSSSNPLIELYDICKEALPPSTPFKWENYSTLDYLNFVGSCSAEEFQSKFIDLCHSLGIDTREAGLKGKQAYDFCCGEDQWTFLDVNSGQFYLGWDNRTAVSSDALRDDPMLVLRAKSNLLNSSMDFVKSCQNFAEFDVIDPQLSPEDKNFDIQPSVQLQGFDLYPGEKLVYCTPDSNNGLQHYERRVDQYVNLKIRNGLGAKGYHSPLPIREISNHTDSILYLSNLDLYVRPKSSISLVDKHVFDLDIEASEDCSGRLVVSSLCSWKLFPAPNSGENRFFLGTDENRSLIEFTYDLNDILANQEHSTVSILNESGLFEFNSPEFILETNQDFPAETIHWQISSNVNFEDIPSNLEQVQPFESSVKLPMISETFLNSDQIYFFRVKGCCEGVWSDWSRLFPFTVRKPLPVGLVEFEKIDSRSYEINWEREADVSDDLIEYYVFGSNAFDFIPSIYTPSQINEIVQTFAVDYDNNNNLVAITTEPWIFVDGSLAYYRIVAKQNGQYSVPSPIIHVYDNDLIYPRSVLSLEEIEAGRFVTKRVLIPPTYAWTEVALPRIGEKNRLYQDSILKIQAILEKQAGTSSNQPSKGYVKPARMPQDVWDKVKSKFFPENHPCKAKIDRIFSRSRVTLTQETMRKAGFNGRTGRYTRVTAVLHAECNECFFKVFCDCELHMRMADWEKWLHRIQGKNIVKECIAKYDFGKWFTVPHKWIYPLPEYPACPKSSRYLPKSFILICSNARLYDHETNKKLWKDKMTRPIMDGLYVLLDECGMWDSVFAFNIPYCKTGKFTWVDTEYYHRWPVTFSKLTKYFSKSNQDYWEYLIHNKGPKWYTRGGEDGRKKVQKK